MDLQHSFHAPAGGDFLGWRRGRSGVTEVVYENLAAHRMVFRLAGEAIGQAVRDSDVAAALSAAVRRPHVLPSLYDELKKRAISFERVLG